MEKLLLLLKDHNIRCIRLILSTMKSREQLKQDLCILCTMTLERHRRQQWNWSLHMSNQYTRSILRKVNQLLKLLDQSIHITVSTRDQSTRNTPPIPSMMKLLQPDRYTQHTPSMMKVLQLRQDQYTQYILLIPSTM